MKRTEDEREKKGKHISREKEKCDKRKTIWRQYGDDIGDLGRNGSAANRRGGPLGTMEEY